MDAEAAMDPDDQQQNRLQGAEQRRIDPETHQFLRITLLDPKLAERDAGSDHVVGEQEWDGEAKDKLGRLESSPTESAPLVERPEAEAHMGQKRSVEDYGARQRLPDQFLDSEAALHCANRNVAERVIGEMQRHIDIKDEPGREPDLAKAGHCGSICAIAARSSSAGSAQVQSAQRTPLMPLSIRSIETAGPPRRISSWRGAGDPTSALIEWNSTFFEEQSLVAAEAKGRCRSYRGQRRSSNCLIRCSRRCIVRVSASYPSL
jgi:hypothetical protein